MEPILLYNRKTGSLEEDAVSPVKAGSFTIARLLGDEEIAAGYATTYTGGLCLIFRFGGSTVILLMKPGAAKIDDDIVEYSGRGIETIVRYGEKIGSKSFK